MKQINDLIVLSVPKGMSNFVVGKNEVWVYDEDGITDNIELPPGQYEIIGLYSEVEEPKVSMILRMSHALVWEIKGAKDFMLRWLHKQYQVPIPTDTTDLLFIHKLK